jgi:hypothetical protein
VAEYVRDVSPKELAHKDSISAKKAAMDMTVVAPMHARVCS